MRPRRVILYLAPGQRDETTADRPPERLGSAISPGSTEARTGLATTAMACSATGLRGHDLPGRRGRSPLTGVPGSVRGQLPDFRVVTRQHVSSPADQGAVGARRGDHASVKTAATQKIYDIPHACSDDPLVQFLDSPVGRRSSPARCSTSRHRADFFDICPPQAVDVVIDPR